MDATDLIIGFARTLKRLTDILAEETRLANEHRYRELDALQPNKTALARAYEQQQTALMKDRSALESLGQDERRALRALYDRFRKTVADNVLALKAAQSATDRVVKLVVNAVKESRGQSSSALPPRAKPGYGAYVRAGAVSFAVDRSL